MSAGVVANRDFVAASLPRSTSTSLTSPLASHVTDHHHDHDHDHDRHCRGAADAGQSAHLLTVEATRPLPHRLAAA